MGESLNINYHRNGNHCYLVLDKKSEVLIGYQMKMVEKANIKSLLSVSTRYLNGEGKFYYDIQSKYSLKNLFEYEMIKKEDLIVLFRCIDHLFSEIEKHLLTVKYIVLNPECIFFDKERKMVFFCFYPEQTKECKDIFMELAEFLIERVKHDDEDSVKLAYEYYEMVVEERYNPSSLVNQYSPMEEEINKIEKLLWSEDEIQNVSEEQTENENRYYFVEPEIEKSELDDNSFIKKIGICFCLTFFAIGIYIFFLLCPGYIKIPWISTKIYFLIGGVLAVIFSLLIFVTIRFYTCKMQKKEEEKVRENIERMKNQEFLSDKLEEQEFEEKRNDSSESMETVILSKGDVSLKPRLLGELDGKQIKLVIDENPYIIGKSSGNAKGIIEDKRISRVHAVIRKDHGSFYISDLNSTNGTFVNNEKLIGTDIVKLCNEDEIILSNIKLKFLC
ncbi:MAG: DUF6382 domain-containing protein [Lachnospiraceae bacterium]|nr:DUF6382 domain-containing protein [Lachnospiraceae bacterium]